MNNYRSIYCLVALVTGALLMGAQVARSDVYFSTGFDAPDYAPGNLVGQEGWQTDMSTGAAQLQVVDKGGNQMLGIIRSSSSNSPRAYLQFASEPLADDITVEMKLAFTGNTDGSRVVYVQDNATGYSGVCVGFNNGNLAVRDGNGGWVEIDADSSQAGMTGASEDTFYRFLATVRASQLQWDVQVFDESDNLVGSVDNIVMKDNVEEFDHIRVYSSAAKDSGAGLYVDDISIAVVPEPASLALCAMGMLSLAMRRRS